MKPKCEGIDAIFIVKTARSHTGRRNFHRKSFLLQRKRLGQLNSQLVFLLGQPSDNENTLLGKEIQESFVSKKII